jgi:hypothetical protein
MNLTKLITGLVIFFSVSTAYGQFLNELKRQTKERVEMVAIQKTADKAGDATANTMDKLFNPNFEGLMKGGGKKVDRAELPDGYEFTYKYSLQMSTKDGSFVFDYYLNPGSGYMGVKMNVGADMFIVMDQDRQVNINYINSGGNSIATASSAIDLDEENIDAYQDLQDYVITDLPNKEFLGYDCIGKQMENEEWKFIMYFATDMEVSFADVFKQDNSKLPPAMQSYSEQFENSLMMFMDMEDKKGKKKKNISGTMECVGIEQVNFSIYNSNYQFM